MVDPNFSFNPLLLPAKVVCCARGGHIVQRSKPDRIPLPPHPCAAKAKVKVKPCLVSKSVRSYIGTIGRPKNAIDVTLQN